MYFGISIKKYMHLYVPDVCHTYLSSEATEESKDKLREGEGEVLVKEIP